MDELDQQSDPNFKYSTNAAIGTYNVGQYITGQVFVPSVSGHITKVRVYFQESTSGSFACQVCNLQNNLPAISFLYQSQQPNTVYTTSTNVMANGVENTNQLGWRSFAFSTSSVLISGIPYAFYVYTTLKDFNLTNVKASQRTDPNQYTKGNLVQLNFSQLPPATYGEQSNWKAYTSSDLTFETYMDWRQLPANRELEASLSSPARTLEPVREITP